ncbi:hypothetical protein DPMN_094910 [Dreissena polymorpha]|uniref:Uncharacterized protein n=1 Tax=Dreissena polymorpha TaxID=45954 RepID=A0A9D4R328_DREPO|nr:hypothetical protein DPMN_094910 [Dreissena polymorpha]
MARQRPTRLVMGPCIVEIDRIVIREVQDQLKVNRWRNKKVIGAPGLVMGPFIYQFDVNRCRNEEIIVKGNFWWVWSMWAGLPRYQFEVNRWRNEEIIVKGNFWWVWSMWAGAPQVEIDRIVIREVQYQLEVNQCKNKEVNFQGSSANSVGRDSGQDGRMYGRTDGRTDGGDNHNIPTHFKKAWG